MNDIDKAIEILKEAGVGTKIDYRYTLDTLNGVKSMAISALQAQAERRWIPVSERLPKKPPNYIDKHGHECFHTSCRVMVCDDKKRVFIADFMFCNEYFWYGYSGNVIKVTHWMPLPQTPEEDSAND